MRSLTTDAPRAPRRFESQLSFESIGLFLFLAIEKICTIGFCERTNKNIVPLLHKHTHTHTQRLHQYLWYCFFVLVCFCIL